MYFPCFLQHCRSWLTSHELAQRDDVVSITAQRNDVVSITAQRNDVVSIASLFLKMVWLSAWKFDGAVKVAMCLKS